MMWSNAFEVYKKIFYNKYPQLRQSQLEIIKEYERIREESKVIEIEASPGVGKSLVNLILAIYEDSGPDKRYDKIVVSTFSKSLQYQYVNEFTDILEKKGYKTAIGLGLKSFTCLRYKKRLDFCITSLGYGCPYMPEIVRGEFSELASSIDKFEYLGGFWLPYVVRSGKGDVVKLKLRKRKTDCLYWVNEAHVLNSKIIFANHYYLITHLYLSEILPVPYVLVVDEAHSLFDVVEKQSTVFLNKYSYSVLEDIGIPKSEVDVISHDEDYNGLSVFLDGYLLELIEDILDAIKGKEHIILQELYHKIKLLTNIREAVDMEGLPYHLAFSMRKKEDYLVIVPTFFSIKSFLDKQLFNLVLKKVILSSATMPPRNLFGNRIYVDKDMYSRHQHPIVYVIDSPSITNNSLADPKVRCFILALVEELWRYKNLRRILIHTINNYMKDLIGSMLVKKGYPVLCTGESIEKDLEKWAQMKEGILVSAGLKEGVDLKYDLCRVQIILKIPKLMSEALSYVRHLAKYDPVMYQWLIAKDIVQMSGRIVRASDDAGLTIILDKRAYKHFKKYVPLYPKYFRKLIYTVKTPTLFKMIEGFAEYLDRMEKVRKGLTSTEDLLKESLDAELSLMKYIKILKRRLSQDSEL